jgi:hypothetical protein
MESFFDRNLLEEPEVTAPATVEPARPLTAADVRAKMLDLIATLEGADQMPFEPAVLKKHKAMFPIMAQWLEREDGEALKQRFTTALARF